MDFSSESEGSVPAQSGLDAPLPFDLGSIQARIDAYHDRLPKAVQVYETLRQAIISMALPPDTVVPEKTLCVAMAVSRTPVREAVLQLASENLVTIKAREGTVVNRIRVSEVLEGHLVRDTLERRLTRLAARNFRPAHRNRFEAALDHQKSAAARQDFDDFFALDNNFHRMICELSGFRNGWRTVHVATGHLDRVRRLAFPVENNLHAVVQEHTSMFERLAAGDENGIEAALAVQLDSIFETIEMVMKKMPDMIEADEAPVASRIR